jgi:hypothetical protein
MFAVESKAWLNPNVIPHESESWKFVAAAEKLRLRKERVTIVARLRRKVLFRRPIAPALNASHSTRTAVAHLVQP